MSWLVAWQGRLRHSRQLCGRVGWVGSGPAATWRVKVCQVSMERGHFGLEAHRLRGETDCSMEEDHVSRAGWGEAGGVKWSK